MDPGLTIHRIMVYYLDPEFDPKKLTKAELRSIMASHGILDLPPPSAKKDELLDLFYKEIVAKRKAILESQKNVIAKSDGIVFLDDSSRPSPKRPKKTSKKNLESASDSEPLSTPTKAETLIDRPATPVNVSTYRLVTRLENLQGKYSASKENLTKKKHRIYLNIAVALVLLLSAVYIYFKFWFIWPMYTDEQLSNLETKPALFLRCPYSKNSSIGSCADGKLYCASGYIEKRNWILFGSTCVVDKERMSLIQSIKKKIVVELQNRLGLSECYNVSPQSISKSELHDHVMNYFKNIKAKTFSDYFDICLRSLLQEGTKIEAQLKDEEIFLKAKEPIFTYYCLAKISIRRVLEERPFEIVSGIFLALISTVMLLQLHSKQKQKRIIRQYYLLICKILKEQNAQHRSDPSVPSFISTNQLRDAVLIKYSTREKVSLWSKIMNEVSRNSNIVESITIFRGEQTRVWEWIGADVSL